MAEQWLDVNSTAEELGISTDAVRKRIARGSLESDRRGGHVLVWLDDGRTEDGHEVQGEVPADGEALVEVLTDQVSYFREQLSEEREARRRADTIIAQLTHTNTQLSNHVLELDAPARSTQAPEPNEEAAQDTTNGAPGPRAPGGRRGGSERLWARVVVAQDVRRAGGGIVLENSDRALEEVHGWSEASLANPREQDAEERRGRRVASEVVALVSASVMVGGGISVLGGVALGAINPFACGMVGVVAGIGLPVLLGSVVGAREGVKGPWWRRIFGG